MEQINIKKVSLKNGELELKLYEVDGLMLLSQKQLATLFEVSIQTIIQRLKHLFKEEPELFQTVKDFLIVQQEGNKRVRRIIKGYDINVAIKIGEKSGSINALELQNYIEQKDRDLYRENNVIIFNNGNVSLDVRVSIEDETVWLNQEQISRLFETTKQNVGQHIKSILNDGELSNSVIKDFFTTANDGKQYLVSFYNLDMILAVGYRIKGRRAIEFRRWASSVLKRYLIDGFAINDDKTIGLRNNLIKLEEEVNKIKTEIVDIKQKTFIEPIKEKIFFDGQYFDAHEFLCALVASANKKVIIIDPYFDVKGLKILSKSKNNVIKEVYYSGKAFLNFKDIQNFKRQYGDVDLYLIKNFHDRFIIIDDNECYLVGASLNYAGFKTFSVMKMEDKANLEMILSRLVI